MANLLQEIFSLFTLLLKNVGILKSTISHEGLATKDIKKYTCLKYKSKIGIRLDCLG